MGHQCQPLQTEGQGRNLSATGGVLAFLFGAWVGAAASRRYEIPKCSFPGGSRQEHEEEGTVDKRKSNWQSRLPPELRESIEKVKAFERRYRKSDSASTTVGGDEGGAKKKSSWTTEWSE